jgi:hypothetical protein
MHAAEISSLNVIHRHNANIKGTHYKHFMRQRGIYTIGKTHI